MISNHRAKKLSNMLYSDEQIDKEKITQDFLLFRECLESLHPSLYRYRKQDEFEEMLNKVVESFSEEMKPIDFYKCLAPLISFIGDGHTSILPNSLFIEELKNKSGVFPLKPIFVNKRFLIAQNYTKFEQLNQNCEVISIDGISIKEIVDSLFNYIQIDGIGNERKYRKLERSFHVLYTLIYGPKTEFIIEFKSLDKEGISNIAVKSVNTEEIEQINKIRYPEELYKPLYNLKFHDDNNIAIITIRSFLNGKKYAKVFKDKQYKKEGKLSKFLKQSFSLIEKKEINNLIIDIRDNDGGKKTNSILLYTYLSREPFNFYKDCYIKKKCYQFLKKNKKIIDSFIVKTLPKLSIEGEYYKFDNYFFMKSLYKTHNLKSNSFTGEIYILINGRTFSAAGEFAAINHNSQRAFIIGEETSAGYLGNTAGHIVRIELPNSKIRLFIPILQFNNNLDSDKSNHGIIPVYKKEQTIDDFISDKDSVLEYTLNLIAKKSL
ncbi:hypothetical protein EU534_00275 [Candidatus Heimdallarchaeota archaeon]|nr:MAG: hypothetical protein EU534_00275 [Candidatus Heimdallarchaeota archaeon]